MPKRNPRAPQIDEATVIAAYQHRLAGHRLVGGTIGVVFAVIFGLRWDGSVHLGIGDGHPLGDVLFCGLAGTVVGALSAETYRLSEPPSSVRVANVWSRSMEPPKYRRQARALTAGTLIVGLVAMAAGRQAPLFIALVGLLSAWVSEATHRAIETRRRPVLSDRAAMVDTALRRFAVVSSAHLQLASAWIVVGWTVAKTGIPGLLMAVPVWTGLILGVVHLRRSSPKHLRLERADGHDRPTAGTIASGSRH